ncbi:hypothetical protein DFR24_0453 [Panacagrimonas perspica]|uniref:ADYC domain-containing protein n=1 Tax=Panacagrimonas perspica TaxID=381431 RepID=A0A4S3K1J9_9GAMM|nr:ADYC domain-containing protein [Panacagrimonas perspica]TDU31094.1 hypothetical protein DFR24_0453 [Panacagrimonas perspica]THD01766.1 hypothetical protein B1810_17300 [Panacagrimonas perspica]
MNTESLFAPFVDRPGFARLLAAALLLVACDRAPAPVQKTPPLSANEAADASLDVPANTSTLTVEGSAFVLRVADGRVLRGAELQGAVLHVALDGGQVAPLKLASIVPDPETPEILRHDFQTSDGQGGWKTACPPNADGETWGFPVSLPEGHPGRDGDVTVTCVSGAVGKCVRWGYPPWMKGPGGEDLAPFHAACVHMARADYCGDNRPRTKEGTSIDNYDDLGIQRRGAAKDPAYVFEAGWGAQGAVCVAHPRWSDVATLEQIQADCPRLAAVPLCNEASARGLGARMFNTSKLLPAR